MSNGWTTFKIHPTPFSPSRLNQSTQMLWFCLCVFMWALLTKAKTQRGKKKYSPKKKRKWFESTQCLEMTLGILLRKHMEFRQESVFKWRSLKLAHFVYDR